MYEASAYGIHRNVAAVVAAAVVAMSGLVFDRAHVASAPEGRIEIGELSPADALPRVAQLPEIVVIGKRA